MADLNSPPNGRAVRGGGAPDLRRPSQQWKASPRGTPLCQPHSELRRPARAHALGLLLGPHARTDRTRDTWVVEARLPAPEGRRLEEGQRLTPDAPQNGGRPPPPQGTAPHQPHGTQPPQGMQAKGTVLGPHTHTPPCTAHELRTPTARPVGGQSGEGERLTSDAPHNGARHPPPGTSFRHPHSEQRRPARAHAVRPVLGPHASKDRIRGTRVAERRLPAPADGRLGEGQRVTPDAPHNDGRPPPPRTAPRHPRGTGPPQGMQAKGTVLGPHTHTPAPTACGWRTPTARPVGGQFGEGERLTTDAPHNSGGHPPGNARHPPPQRATPARKGARCEAGARSHARTDRTRDTRVAEPQLPAPEDERPGEGQRLTPDAPHNGGRPPPPGTGPHEPHGTQPPQGMQAKGTVLGPHTHTTAPTARGWRTPTARPVGGQSGEGERLTTDAPHNSGRHLPRGTPIRHPHSEQRRPARAHAVGPVLGPQACTDRTRDTRVAEPRLPAPEDGRPGEGQRLTPDAPQNGGRPPLPGTAPHNPPRHAAPTGHAGQGDSVGPPHPRARPTACGWQTQTASSVGGQFGEGERLTTDASHNGGRHPPGNALPPPRQRATPARRGARCGAGAGSHARTNHTRDTQVAEPRPPAPEGGRPGETAPDTRGPSQRWRATPPRGGPPPPPRHAAPTGHAGQGDTVGPPHPHARARSTWVADSNSPPSGRAVGGGERLTSDAPHNSGRHPPRGCFSASPTASNAGPQGRTLWGRCGSPRPHRPHPGHTGRGNPAARPRGLAAGGGTAPDTRRPSQRWQANPPGNGPPPPPRRAAPTGHAGEGDSVGPPHPHARAHSTWLADPKGPPSGRAVGGGGAPDLRRPSQRWKAPFPATPFRHPDSEQRRPARAHAVEPVLGPHAHTDRTRDTRVAVPRLPAPEDGRSGEGQRLTPDAPHYSGRPPPPGDGPLPP